MMGRRGVLIISHGSREAQWVREVDEAIAPLHRMFNLPIVTAFLELVPGRLIQDGLDRLEAIGVTEIVIIPLFVSSGSTHIEQLRQAFNVDRTTSEANDPLPVEHFRVHAQVTFGTPMDDDPLVGNILYDHILRLQTRDDDDHCKDRDTDRDTDRDVERCADRSDGNHRNDHRDADRDTDRYADRGDDDHRDDVILLIGHGSRLPGFYEKWEQGLQRIGARIREMGRYNTVMTAMLTPDQVGERLDEIRRIAPHASPIVLPIFLSEGYFTKVVIPKRLKGFAVRYDGRALLPNIGVTKWLAKQIERLCFERFDD